MNQKISIKLFLYSLRALAFVNKFSSITYTNNLDIIFCYHDIASDGWEFSSTKEVFEKHIKLISGKAKIVSLSEMLKQKNKNKTVRVAITFDDGYEGVYKYAFPILKKYNAVGSVFILGKNVNPKINFAAKLLNLAQIKELAKNGWDIGWHTNSHPDVTLLNSTALKEELFEAKKVIEKKLKLQLKYFAYPFGRYSYKVVRLFPESDFEAAFTVDGNRLSKDQGKFRLNRITISKYISDAELAGLLSPAGIWVNKIFTSLWRFKDSI